MNNHLSSSKLPTPLASESTRRDVGNFFPLPGFASPQSSCSFESLIPKNDAKQRKDEDQEEIESAKKRKKAQQQVDQQGVTLPTSVPTALCATPDLDAPISNGEIREETEKTNSDSLRSTDKGPKKSADQDTKVANTVDELKKECVEDLQLKNSIESTIQPSHHGIENAPNDAEMISIVTSDAMEFGTSPLNGLSLASTPVTNSMEASMADESSVSPVQTTGGSSESSLGNFSQGAGASGTPLFNNLTGKASRTSEATTVFKTLSIEVEKLKQTGKSQIDLELPVSETESVKIRLQVRGNEIRSVFITESPELRNALQKSWGEFAQNSRDRGFRFGDPSFQNPTSQNSAFEQGQQKGQSRNPQANEPSYPGYSVNRQQPRRTTTSPTSGNSVSLWA